jgi:EAL domain-containing protein (putative c-di-GMP-specific phosphodiesterase class I)
MMDIDILEKNAPISHEKPVLDRTLSAGNNENNISSSPPSVSDFVMTHHSVHETHAVNMTVHDVPITNPMINIASYPLPDVMKSVRYALERNAIDTCVLPIIHAGDKQTYFYHTYSYLRDKDDLYHNSSDFMVSLKQTGLDIAIDRITIIRSVQAIKALHYANYALGLFVTANLKTVTHDDFFDELMDMVQEKTKIADGLIFHLTQSQIAGLTAMRIDRLSALHQHGVLFSLGGIDDNLPDLTELVKIGFKFIHLSQHNIKDGIMINHQHINAIYMHSLCQKLGMQMILSDINSHDDVLNIVNVKSDFLHGKAFGTLEKLEHIQL